MREQESRALLVSYHDHDDNLSTPHETDGERTSREKIRARELNRPNAFARTCASGSDEPN